MDRGTWIKKAAEVLIRVSDGANCYNDTYYWCAFCMEDLATVPDEHKSDCPVRLANDLIKDVVGEIDNAQL